MTDNKIRSNLLCGECGREEADSLLFFQKIQPETGKAVFFDPRLSCKECREKWDKADTRFECRPYRVMFLDLAKVGHDVAVRKIGWLTGKKGKESNALCNPFWKKKIWNAYYIHHAEYVKALNE